MIVATRYEVLVEHKHAAQARELLAGLPGALPDPFAEELVIVPAKGVERWLALDPSPAERRAVPRKTSAA